METSTEKRVGFWGTFRSYLVAASVLCVLAGVIYLYPAIYAVRSFGTPGAVTISDYPIVFGLLLALPPWCFLAPLIAYFIYQSGKQGTAIIVVLLPLSFAIALGLYWSVTEF